MSNQIVISSGAKVRSLNGVITGTTGVLDALPINAANGIPQLDVNGKILVSQLPNSVMEYQGTWNANTNTPTLTNGGAFNQGDVYLCNVAGTTDFGAGPISFVVGDQVIYSGSIWQRASGSTGTVTSVAVTESGDALTITGSPITTSGTINVGFAGTSAQYVAGNGALVTFPDLTGYVTLTTSQTITGLKTFNTPIALDNALNLKFDASINAFGGYYSLYAIKGVSSGNSILALYDGDTNKKSSLTFDNSNNFNYLFPSASGTVALTSDLTGGTVTSVGLTMPVAFNVASSPITTSGTLAVTAAGYASQYIRGDGTLADFPSSGGGGSSVSYYLNGGTSQGVIGGTTYYEMSKTADTGTGVDFPKSGDGLIVSFLTDANDPAQLTIPGGNWNYEIYVSMSSNGGTPQLYAELYKYDGTTFTLISTSSNEIIYDGVNLNLYTFAMAVPTTTLTVTDRLAVKLYATNSGGKTTTVHTQNGHLCQVITTFSTGITALNGLTTQVQYLATGTSGTDFNISSATATHTFNLPTASAANRGALSSADWTTFNNKQNALSLTTTGNSGSATLVSNTLNVPTYTLAGLGGISLTSLSATTPLSYNNTTGAFSIQVANTSQDGYLSSTDWNTFNGKQNTITNPVTGTGTSGQVTYFNGTSSVTSSSSFKFDGTNLTIGNPSSALAQLHVYNASAAATILLQTNSTTDYSEIAVRNNSSTATSYFRQYSTAATGSDFGISRAGLALFFSNYATNFAIGTRNGGDLILGTADTERARILASNGYFGLGTSTPSYQLDVNGTGRFTSQLRLDSTITNGTYTYTLPGATGTLALTSALSSYLPLAGGTLTGALGGTSATFSGAINLTGTANTFQVASIFRNANRVFFGGDTGGYFFQNSANTVTVLQIADSGAATFSSSVSSNSGADTYFQLARASGDYAFQIYRNFSGGYDVLRAKLSDNTTWHNYITMGEGNSTHASSNLYMQEQGGNVGIGTSSPISPANSYRYLHIEGGNSTSGGVLYLSTSSNGNSSQIYADTSGLNINTNTSLPIIFNPAGAERMRITSGGDLLVGTTGLSVGARLQLKGAASASAMSIDIGTNGYPAITFQNTSGAQQGYIVTNSSSVQYLSISDYRLKNDFKDYSGLDLVNKIKTYDYQWKLDKTRAYGVVAHELQEVIPQAVSGEKDGEQMQGVDYSKIVPILVKAIQEQQKQIEELKLKIK